MLAGSSAWHRQPHRVAGLRFSGPAFVCGSPGAHPSDKGVVGMWTPLENTPRRQLSMQAATYLCACPAWAGTA